MEVRCWCCEHYPYLNVNFGMCDLKNKTVAALDNVCEHFERKAGLRFHTELSSCEKTVRKIRQNLSYPREHTVLSSRLIKNIRPGIKTKNLHKIVLEAKNLLTKP